MEDNSILGKLLEKAESDLAEIRRRRAELERAERMAAEKVSHLRALIELSANASDSDLNTKRPSAAPEVDLRIEDIAAEILRERGALHYRELYVECEHRGGVIVSSNPAAVLLTRILRDARFRRAQQRGWYRLAEPGEEALAPWGIGHRRRKRRRRGRRPVEEPP